MTLSKNAYTKFYAGPGILLGSHVDKVRLTLSTFLIKDRQGVRSEDMALWAEYLDGIAVYTVAPSV